MLGVLYSIIVGGECRNRKMYPRIPILIIYTCVYECLGVCV